MTSEGVTAGVVQVPPGGQPIVLLADRQTVGGYPKIATVASVDLPLLAQLRAGDTIGFAEVSIAEAQELCLSSERLLATVKQGIALHVT
jgi:antagonist of KipI